MTGHYAEGMILALIMVIILLIIIAMTIEYHADRVQERADQACKHLSNVLYVLQNCELKTGVCCCGDQMDRHDLAWNCGHSPLDMFDHYGLPVVDAAQKFIEQYTPEE